MLAHGQDETGIELAVAPVAQLVGEIPLRRQQAAVWALDLEVVVPRTRPIGRRDDGRKGPGAARHSFGGRAADARLTFPPGRDPGVVRELASLEVGGDAKEASYGGAGHWAAAAG